MVKPIETINALIDASQYKEAINLLEPLALQGKSEAQNKLGELYHFAPAGIRDFSKAKGWYLEAVNKGNGEAANHLGRLYLNGEGVNLDKETALHWYKKGMELGNACAECNYYSVTNNPFYYVLKKALTDDREACLVAAHFYECGGVGVPKDSKKAAEYHKRAKELDS